MKLTLRIFGGFAGGIRRLPKVLDTELLEEAKSNRIRDLVDKLRSESTRLENVEKPQPDSMSYRLEVSEGETNFQLSCSDAAMSDTFGELVNAVQGH